MKKLSDLVRKGSQSGHALAERIRGYCPFERRGHGSIIARAPGELTETRFGRQDDTIEVTTKAPAVERSRLDDRSRAKQQPPLLKYNSGPRPKTGCAFHRQGGNAAKRTAAVAARLLI